MKRSLMDAALLALAFGASACQPAPAPPPPAIHARARIVDAGTRLPRAGVTVRVTDRQNVVPEVKTVSESDGVVRFDLVDPKGSYKFEITLPECRSEKCSVCAASRSLGNTIDRFCSDLSATELERRDYKDPTYWALAPYRGNHGANVRDGQLDLGDLFVIDEQQVVGTYAPVCARLARGARLTAPPVSDGKGCVVLVDKEFRADLSSSHADKWNLICIARNLEQVGTYKKVESGESVGDAYYQGWKVAAVRKDGQVFRTDMGVGASMTVSSVASESYNQQKELVQRLYVWLQQNEGSAAH
jgi:hypothetical protein